jgi:acyl-CoA synthetase (AMP-forming)/AMP-acid ligase II
MLWDNIHVFGDVPRSLSAIFRNKLALVSGASSITFANLNARMNRLANGLTQLGLRQGDRVALLAKNRPEVVETYGASKAGIAVIPLNWRLSPSELLHPLSDGEPAALLAEPAFAPMIDELRTQLGSVRHFIQFGPSQEKWLAYEAVLAEGLTAEPDILVRPTDLLCLMYTSGTTGKPKGAMLTHRGLLRNCMAAVGMLGIEETDVALAATPLFHVGGMWYHLFPSFARGCTIVLLPEFSVADMVDAVAKDSVTFAHLVPTMISALLSQPCVSNADFSRFRLVYYAGSSIPLELLRKAMAALPSCAFLQSYGSTEAGIVTLLRPQDHREALGSPNGGRLRTCGTPLDCEVRILDVGADGIGEIAIRSDRTMAGYWRNPAATKAAMSGGWLRTGDLGSIDDRGYLTIIDRKNDVIVSGGENVYPREVEDALYRDPAVREAAVFGIPDPHWVERVAAAVVLTPGATATAKDLSQRLRTRLAGYKCPKTIFLCDQLPKSGAGKILKKELRRRYAGA